MARPSKLTETQWEEIRKRLLAGEKAADLAREFGVSKAAISTRVSKRIETIKTVANQIVTADEALRSLSISEQRDALTLADDLKSISKNLASAARYGAATAHRLSALANSQTELVDDADPLSTSAQLKSVAMLQSLANEAAKTPLNLLAANKEEVARVNRGDADKKPLTLSDLYDD